MIDRLADPRFLVSLIVMGIFGWAFASNVSDDTMKGAIIGALNIAVGFWLGSSRGAQSQTENIGKALDLATTNAPPAIPDVMLKPGETAKAEEQPQ
jgi:hypothetical protein